MRKTLIVLFATVAALIWVYGLYSGLTTAMNLRSAGVDDFSMVTLPFLMPILGISLSAFAVPWLAKIGKMSAALALGGFSLSAAIVVVWVAGAASAG
jgi:hypothetical protein